MTAAEFEMTPEMRRMREPFALNTGSRLGMLCMHGFSGSPFEMRPLAEHFAARGFHTVVPLLPRHGDLPEKLKGSVWPMWVQAARAALDALNSTCDQIVLAGLSMGGLLMLHLAAQESARPASSVRALITLAAPAGLSDKRSELVKYARFVLPWFYPFQFADLSDPNLRARLQRNYKGADLNNPALIAFLKKRIRLPLDAIYQLQVFNKLVLRELSAITLPAFVAQGRKDVTVAADSATVIGAALGSQRKHIGWYEGFDHEMPLEPDAPRLFSDIEVFLDDVLRDRA